MYYSRSNFLTIGICLMLLTSLVGCDRSNPASKTKNNDSSTEKTSAATENNKKSEDQGPLPADVIARVGTWQLTTDEFAQRLKILKQGLPDFNDNDIQTKAAVVDELIRQQLLAQDAESSDIGQMKDIKDAVDDFRRTLLIQELANRITKGITVTEEDAKKFYDLNKKSFVDPVKWKVRQIVVDDEDTAKNLLVQILQGGDFSALAKDQSKDSKSAKNGGALPEFVQAPFEAMQKAIASLDSKATSAVFKGPKGYYIVHIDSKEEGSQKSFDDVKKDLISGLTLRKQQSALLGYIEKLSQKTKVDVNKELIGISDKK